MPFRKVNTNEVPEDFSSSPKGRFGHGGRGISEALGRNRDSLDLSERHPFDVEIQRIPPGMRATVFHSHSAQWEFYHVISGSGNVRHDAGTEPIVAGDAFLFKPGEAHQLINTGAEDLVVYVVADNPIGETAHYPDSGKFAVRSPQRRIIRSESSQSLDYWDGEE
jgi:uncharacterized cupin superfamily protein